MSQLGQPFFGLTLASKTDLFIREIQFLMRAYQSGDYWSYYCLPVPIRRFLIEEFNKQMTEESKGHPGHQDTTKPLSDTEKQAIKQRQQNMFPPMKNPGHEAFMSPVRNK